MSTMAVVGPSCRSNSRHMSMTTLNPAPHQHQAILAAAQPFAAYSTAINIQDVQPDRPIGYGAFGVVW